MDSEDSFINIGGCRRGFRILSASAYILLAALVFFILPLIYGCRVEDGKAGKPTTVPVGLKSGPIKKGLERELTPIMIEAEPTWEGGDEIRPVSPAEGSIDGGNGRFSGGESEIELPGIIERGGLKREDAFSLQVGAFIHDENLNRVRDTVSQLGYSPYIKEIDRVIVMYCPVVGKNLKKDEAKDLMEKLDLEGFGAVPLEEEGGLVDVVSGFFYYKDDAETVQDRLESLGYDVDIEGRRVEVTFKRLRIGSYGTIEDAKRDLGVLKKEGFSPIIVNKDQ
jgi:cell division septation protein DedD